MARAAENNAQLLANSLAPMLVFDDRAAAAAELRAFSLRADLQALRVLSARQTLFAQWPEAPGALEACLDVPPLLAGLEPSREMHFDHLDVSVPIQFKNEVVGRLILRSSLAQVQLAVYRMVLVGAALIAVAIGLAGLLLRWVQGRALAPIVELSELAERVAKDQNYSHRAQVHRPDEVGRLSERFNQMLQRVELGQAELTQRLRHEQLAGQQFEQMAHQDSLTQLPNRLFFQTALQAQVESCLRSQQRLALMFIDLDNFKFVNDSQGHEAGDAALREVAARMGRVLRNGDTSVSLGRR
ncbi:MAG: diguanylate cyclase [Ideonella sp.]|nr:diguanylate cyclase [Ideonella sp.]